MDNHDKRLPFDAMTMSNAGQTNRARRRSLQRKRRRARQAAGRAAQAAKDPTDMSARQKYGAEGQKTENANSTCTVGNQNKSTPKFLKSTGGESSPTKASDSVKKDATARTDAEGYGTSKSGAPSQEGQKLGVSPYNEQSTNLITPPTKASFAEDDVLNNSKASGRNGVLSSAANEVRVAPRVFVNSSTPATGCIRRAQLAEDTSDQANNHCNEGHSNDAAKSPGIISRTATGSEGTPTPAAKKSVLKPVEAGPNVTGVSQEQLVSGSSAANDKIDISKETKQKTEPSHAPDQVVNTTTTTTRSAFRRRQTAYHQQQCHNHRSSVSCPACLVFHKPCATVDPSHRHLAIASLRMRKCTQALQLSVRQLNASARVYQREADSRAAGNKAGREITGSV